MSPRLTHIFQLVSLHATHLTSPSPHSHLVVSLLDDAVKASAFLWRNVQMEEYKAKHGHYPH